jgi:hypothetical protein
VQSSFAAPPSPAGTLVLATKRLADGVRDAFGPRAVSSRACSSQAARGAVAGLCLLAAGCRCAEPTFTSADATGVQEVQNCLTYRTITKYFVDSMT